MKVPFRRLVIDRDKDELLLCLSQEAFDSFDKVKKIESEDEVIDVFGYIWSTWYELTV